MAPLILQGAELFPAQFAPESVQLVFQTCILSILLTAPAGQLIIWEFGKRLLHKSSHDKVDKTPVNDDKNEEIDLKDDIFYEGEDENSVKDKENGKSKSSGKDKISPIDRKSEIYKVDRV